MEADLKKVADRLEAERKERLADAEQNLDDNYSLIVRKAIRALRAGMDVEELLKLQDAMYADSGVAVFEALTDWCHYVLPSGGFGR